MDGFAPVSVDLGPALVGLSRCQPATLELEPAAPTPSRTVTAVGPTGPVRRFEVSGCLARSLARRGRATFAPRASDCLVVAITDGGTSWPAPPDALDLPLYVGPRALDAVDLPVTRRGRSWVTVPVAGGVSDPGMVLVAVDGRSARGRRGFERLVEAASDVACEHRFDLLREGMPLERRSNPGHHCGADPGDE